MPASQEAKFQAVPDIMRQAREQVNRNPAIRNAISRLLQDDIDRIKGIAIEIAATDLHNDRPANRRSKLTKGRRHYIDSFATHYYDSTDLRSVRMVLTNNSPVAVIIEEGARSHQIRAGEGKWLTFPSYYPESASGHASPGSKGDWALLYGEGHTYRKKRIWSHPGQAPLHILRRSLDRYTRQTRKERDLTGR